MILGIELNRSCAQITYYHQSVREPVTLGAASDAEEDRLPMGLRLDGQGEWQLWDGGQVQDGPDGSCVDDLYGRLARRETVVCGGQELAPAQLLAVYFRLCISRLGTLAEDAGLCVMVTVKELDDGWGGMIAEALELCGLDRRQIYFQDYLSSFYYYVINQKKELWYQDVALLTCEDDVIRGYVLHIDRSTRPAVASVEQAAEQAVDGSVRAGLGEAEWRKEKDRLFFELLKRVFERRNVSSSYLLGDYFNKSWAERSIQYLCYKRHAFQGGNLYSKGACYAAMERAGLSADPGIIFSGLDMVEYNLGMEMRIRGKETYYPLVSAGVNWYEAHHTCEFILNGEREIRVISKPMAQGDSVIHMMRLPGLPPRPDRATRLRLTVYFSSAHTCHLEVEDLGFGGFYRASGLIWHRTLEF